ncbi:hypothetical protein SLS53_000417 [Cytospora paraplurivora]|uniref:Uncharacterized protein n=1 Tax=Cytospora paraplurivora TaxID=2898453 RepID=A0AAN9UMU7_9PEZI
MLYVNYQPLTRSTGPVVRTAPDELSFNSAQSWKDIYGFRPGHKTFVKSDFYDGGSFAGQGMHSIVSEREPEVHGQMRRYLSHAFSDKSLSEQEEMISSSIDQFVLSLEERSAGEKGHNITKGFETLTFDIIGDLAFGESFGALNSDEPHPWISIAMGALSQGALVDVFKRFPGVADILMTVLDRKIKKLTADTKSNEDFAINLVNKRIRQETERKDFMTRILEQRDPEKVSDLQLAAHASDFVLAGSETTATCLAATTYHLLHNREVLTRLQEEIRSTFKSYGEIDAQSALPLPYLRAVILEGLRIYPPLPLGLPRVVPEGGDTVDGHLLPEKTIVSTNPLAATLDPANFTDPLQFRPERWLGQNEKDVLDASQPFSLGPRGCLGRHLGWMELSTTIAKLVWVYDLEPLDRSLDWHRDSHMHTLWIKPKLLVRAKNRGVEVKA